MWEQIYAAIQKIPAGQVATYGQIAALAGLPGHARQVGYALSALPDGSSVPWHRVVNARGEISLRSGGSDSHLLQRARLEAEGVAFDAQGRIPLELFQWRPELQIEAEKADQAKTKLNLKPVSRDDATTQRLKS
jgi:methylated-DNA-protein-cysteine methyltransferase related protein